MDDAALVVRGAALKFADSDDDSPLDLLMNTGETAPFFNAWTFLQFMYLTIRGRNPHAIPYMKKYPIAARGVQVSLRRDPESFGLMSYYSKTPLLFEAKDGVTRYVKFRLLPELDGEESGLPDAESLETPWEQQTAPGETRPPDYLKEEYRRRATEEGVRYRLQLQLNEMEVGERREITLNASIAWDEKDNPWHNLGTVEIDEVMPHEEGNQSRFSLTHHPEGLSFIPPRSIHDPPSLELLRRRGVWARRARLLGYRVFGLPDQTPEDRSKFETQKHSEFVLPPRQIVTLPQQDGDEGRRIREQKLEVARGEYQWASEPGLPPYVRDVPGTEQFSDEKDVRMLMDIGSSILDLGLGSLENLIEGAKESLHTDFSWLYPHRDIPTVSQRIKRDDEFGRQRLAGVNPVLIERCSTIPDHFAVNDELVKGLLGPGETLSDAQAEGRLYITDYQAIDGLPAKDGRYVTAPLCLLYVNAERQLVPIAIQLGQSPGDGPVFTPKDRHWLWQTAKTWVQTADAQYHEANSHLLRTHMVMEPFAVATMRQLGVRHPVACMLRPHFRDTMAINYSARTNMLAPDGAIDRTMALGAEGSLEAAKRGYAEWRFDRFDLRNNLRARGVDDRDALPGYHYRDDSLLLWTSIHEFVGNVLTLYYPEDSDVAADWELQAWIRELASPDAGAVRGLPNNGALNTRAELHQVVAQTVFTCSAEHASVNNGQFEMFGYPPNVPGAMYRPPPQTRDELSEEFLMESLPGPRAAAEQVGMVHLLSMPTDDPLGNYSPDFFIGDPRVAELVTDFRARLHKVSEAISQRNASLEVPYTYLDPAQIGQSIAI